MNSTLALPETRLGLAGWHRADEECAVPFRWHSGQISAVSMITGLALPCLLHTAAALKDALASFISTQSCCIVFSACRGHSNLLSLTSIFRFNSFEDHCHRDYQLLQPPRPPIFQLPVAPQFGGEHATLTHCTRTPVSGAPVECYQ